MAKQNKNVTTTIPPTPITVFLNLNKCNQTVT